MNIIILDLEWNTAYCRKREKFVNEIIEFGAVRLGHRLGEADRFQAFVKSSLSKKLRGRVKELTHITNEELRDQGRPFAEVMEQFSRWAGRHSVILTWSTTDIFTLLDNCRTFLNLETIPFLDKYADLQKYVQDCVGQGKSRQLGLSAAAELLGIDPAEFDTHRAADDSRLSAEILRACYDEKRFKASIQNARDPEFFARMTFKPVVLNNLKDPLIDRNDMTFRCEKCGALLRRRSRWSFKSKYFHADLYCRACDRQYKGRVQFKKLYDSVVVRKVLIAAEPET